MHEYVYADRILQTVLEETGGRKRPKTVTVEIGGLLGLTRESLSTAYEVLAKGTRAEGSKLVIKFSKGSAECPECGYEGSLRVSGHQHIVDPVFLCPKCGSSLNVKGGLEAKLVSVS